MSQKRIILSDSSLNRYGYRVLTSGMLLEAFKKNPVMLYMHFRDEGSPIWGETKAIGHWEDIQLEGDVLSAIPVFDKVDQLSKDIAAKYEAGTYNAASVGIRIIATSANKDLLVPGQTRETVTESELCLLYTSPYLELIGKLHPALSAVWSHTSSRRETRTTETPSRNGRNSSILGR